MKVVVTGASGHIGNNLVRALLDRGETVRALVHSSVAGLDGLDVEVARGDVCDPLTLRRAFEGVDVVYHTAGRISISASDAAETHEVNVTGVSNVVQACLDYGVRRLVHLSSIHAMIDPPGSAEIDESAPLALDGACSPYDRSKARGEAVILDAVASGLDAVVVAPTAVIGPHDYRPSFFGQVLIAMARNRLPVKVAGGFDWVDVRDVVAGTLSAAAHGRSGEKYLLSGHWVSLSSVADAVAAFMDRSAPRLCVPLAVAQAFSPLVERICRLTDVTPLCTSYSVDALRHHRNVSHAKASRQLGYAPRTFEETIEDTCLWFGGHGQLGPGCRRGDICR